MNACFDLKIPNRSFLTSVDVKYVFKVEYVAGFIL